MSFIVTVFYNPIGAFCFLSSKDKIYLKCGSLLANSGSFPLTFEFILVAVSLEEDSYIVFTLAMVLIPF